VAILGAVAGATRLTGLGNISQLVISSGVENGVSGSSDMDCIAAWESGE
jgi:hypothetical protein